MGKIYCYNENVLLLIKKYLHWIDVEKRHPNSGFAKVRKEADKKLRRTIKEMAIRKYIPYKIIPPSGISHDPLFGSGKITRRVIIKSFRSKKSNDFSQMLKKKLGHFTGQVTKKKLAKPIPFKTTAAKIIFFYWNGLGYPLVRHQLILNKTNFLAVERLNKNIKKHGKEKITFAIKNAYEMFNAKWFKYRLYISNSKISLPDFFRYSNTRFKMVVKKCPNTPRSWFKECLKGEEYLMQTYSVRMKDKYPEITKKLLAIWKLYCKYDIINVRDINNLIICSQYLYEFSQRNRVDHFVIVDIIDNMLNKWKTYSPKHSGYLINSIFWQEQLIKELIRYGLFSSKREIK